MGDEYGYVEDCRVLAGCMLPKGAFFNYPKALLTGYRNLQTADTYTLPPSPLTFFRTPYYLLEYDLPAPIL